MNIIKDSGSIIYWKQKKVQDRKEGKYDEG